MQVSNIGSNMTEIKTRAATVLISYKTPVAAAVGGHFYRTEKKWSVTTSRHINKWLDGATADERPQEYFDELLEE